MTYQDQYYSDNSNGVHFLSAADQANAADDSWAGPKLPDPTWTAISAEAALAILKPAPTLDQAKAVQIVLLNAAYKAAANAPASFTTAAGTESSFPQTDEAKTYLAQCIEAGAAAWTLNLWLDVNNVAVTPFTFADLQGLAAAMEAVEVPAYQDLLAKVAEVNAATTVEAVQAVSF